LLAVQSDRTHLRPLMHHIFSPITTVNHVNHGVTTRTKVPMVGAGSIQVLHIQT
jgi:hypothetical protein